MSGGMLSDASYVANRLSWTGAALLGFVSFIVFYWLLPMWINHQLNSLQGNMFRPMVEAVFSRRIHWLQWLGIALGLICAFFSIRNYLGLNRLHSGGERNVSFFSRLLARWLD
ncbi:MAG: hypothetical protein ACXWTP_00210 [Methylosarcina sp.]